MNREHAMRTFSLVPACSTSSLGRRGTVDGIFCFSPRSLCLSLYDRPVQPATTYLGHFTFCFSPRSLCLSLLQPASSTSNNISRSLYLLFQSQIILCFSPKSLCFSPKSLCFRPKSLCRHYFYDRLVKPAAKSHFAFCFSPKLFSFSPRSLRILVPSHFVFLSQVTFS